jgi:hypothetical protein
MIPRSQACIDRSRRLAGLHGSRRMIEGAVGGRVPQLHQGNLQEVDT